MRSYPAGVLLTKLDPFWQSVAYVVVGRSLVQKSSELLLQFALCTAMPLFNFLTSFDLDSLSLIDYDQVGEPCPGSKITIRESFLQWPLPGGQLHVALNPFGIGTVK